MSKRSKLKMFRKQQEITEGSDDDQEMIIPPQRGSTSSSCASGELSDDSHGQMIVTSASAKPTTLITVPDDAMQVAISTEHVNDSFTADDEVDGGNREFTRRSKAEEGL